MSDERRLHDLYTALTVEERLAAVLSRHWAGEPHDDLLTDTVAPGTDHDRFWDLLTRARDASFILGIVALIVRLEAEHLHERWATLCALGLGGLLVDQLAGYIQLEVPEPVTESEYRERLAELRTERLSLDEVG